MIKGTSSSPGIALGRVLLLESKELNIEKKSIENIDFEKKKFLNAIEKSKKQLIKIKEKTLMELGEDKSKIFESHIMILQDPELIDATVQKIDKDKVNSEYALWKIRNNFISLLKNVEDEYIKERCIDIKDVSDRIIRNIINEEYVNLSNLKEDVILVCNDLTPSQTINMDKEKVLGILTNIGGSTSHTAIMARALGIPSVMGLKDITSKVRNGDFIIIDGYKKEVIINPDEDTKKKYNKLNEDDKNKINMLYKLVGKKTKTLDGRYVELSGNIGTLKDMEGLIKNDAEGVGLYRTEFLYMDRDKLPSEQEQFQAYKKVLKAMKFKPVIIRTLDIGGDKQLPYLEIDKEVNPFLGYRAIRFCLDKVDIFKTQFRALLRSSVYGNLRIMFPMVSSLEELFRAKDILKEAKFELDKEGISYSNNIQIGVMIEVPSAAIISDILAKHVDFFSIGTNDLIQYTCAVDRMNQKIHYLYNQFNPAVLRLIKLIIDNGHREGKWVGMCGEAAGDKKIIPILIGMGLDELSVNPISILPTRKLINSLNYQDGKKLSNEILKFDSAEKIEEYIKRNSII